MKSEGIRNWFLVGRGPSLAAVRTGALIIKESVRVAAEGLSSAAFRHGPMEMLSPETFVVIFSGDEKGKALNVSLHDDIGKLGYKSGLIGQDANGAFLLPPVPGSVRPILEIMPIQMLTLAFASRAGIEAGRFAVGSKVTTLEKRPTG